MRGREGRRDDGGMEGRLVGGWPRSVSVQPSINFALIPRLRAGKQTQRTQGGKRTKKSKNIKGERELNQKYIIKKYSKDKTYKVFSEL